MKKVVKVFSQFLPSRNLQSSAHEDMNDKGIL